MRFALLALLTTLLSSTGVGGLIGHWTFDEATGDVAKDSSGRGRDGKLHGAVRVQGKLGRALRFDGQRAYVALGDLGEHKAVTLAFWMKPANVAKANEWQGLVTSDGWEEGVLHIPIRSNIVDVYLHTGEKRRGRLRSTPLRNNAWYHVAITADTGSRSLRLYTNGAEEDGADISALTTPIKLVGQVVGREFNGRYFQGLIDDVRIYDHALGLDEIRALCPDAVPLAGRDPRNIRTGLRIPDENYADQPYVVITRQGHWLCTLTTGPGREGHHGQHIVATVSTDKGRTWSKPVDIEPTDGPEASWVVPLIVPSGRVYAFYTYNGDDVRTLKGKAIRADVIGWYACKYSDDGGRTWSKKRYRLPMRLTACDRGNDFGGKVRIFWGIHKPIVVGSSAYFAFTKLGKFMLDLGEGWFYHSPNILTEPDPAKLRWELLPDGDHGLRAPEFRSVQEEHNMVALDERTFYCVYRTSLGHPCHAYSADGCHTWTKPEFMTYTPGGRKMKTPRACPQVWKCANGKYLFWFHNHNKQGWGQRNPAWIAGGVARDGRIHWSQPEILLFDPAPSVTMSYPNLIEQDGRTWVTETNKTIARVHEIDPSLLEGLWGQGQVKTVARKGLVLDLGPEPLRTSESKPLPAVNLEETGGLSLGCWLALPDLSPGQVLLDSRDAAGKGLALTTGEKGTLRIHLGDGERKATWDSDPGLLQAGKLHHVVFIADAGPRIITVVVDGVLCDGGEARTHGWGRFLDGLGVVGGSGKLRIAPSLRGKLRRLRLYGRALRTSEAVASFHAGP